MELEETHDGGMRKPLRVVELTPQTNRCTRVIRAVGMRRLDRDVPGCTRVSGKGIACAKHDCRPADTERLLEKESITQYRARLEHWTDRHIAEGSDGRSAFDRP